MKMKKNIWRSLALLHSLMYCPVFAKTLMTSCWLFKGMGIVRPWAYLRPMNFLCTFIAMLYYALEGHKISCTTPQSLFSIPMPDLTCILG